MRTKPYQNGLEKSIIYEKSLVFAKEIYMVSEGFHDKYIIGETRKSATSVVTNIAQSRSTLSYGKEFSYLNDTLVTIHKCRALMDIALVQSRISYETYQKVDSLAFEMLRMSISLMNRAKQHINENEQDKMVAVVDFRRSHMYQRSIDLMQILYWFMDSDQLKMDLRDVNYAYESGVKIPHIIASAIGQINLDIRFKMLNEAKTSLKELNKLLSEIQGLSCYQQEERVKVTDCITQILKMLSSHFAYLKSSNTIKQ
jgi:four helix bundle protein